MKMIRRILLPALLLAFGSTAQAAPIRYDFSGTCSITCANLGLASGAGVSGFIVAGDGFATDGVLRGSELTDFGFTFGNIAINSLTHSVIGLASVNSSLDLSGVGFSFLGAQSQASIGAIPVGAFGFAYSGWLVNRTVQIGGFPFTFAAAGGPGSFTRATSVPEPATLGLLGLGLLGTAVMRRRRTG